MYDKKTLRVIYVVKEPEDETTNQEALKKLSNHKEQQYRKIQGINYQGETINIWILRTTTTDN